MDEKEAKGIKIWKLLFILSFVFLGISGFIYISDKPLEEEVVVINNNYNSQTISNITFEKIKIYERNNKYYFTAKAINKTKNDIKLDRIEINLDNYKFYSYIGDNLKSSEYKMIFMETNQDISKIKTVSFSI